MIKRGIELGYDIELVEADLPAETVLFADPSCLVVTRGGKLETEWEEEQIVWAQLTVHIKTQDLDRIAKVLKDIPDGKGLDFSLDVVCVFEADLEAMADHYPQILQAGSIEELVSVDSKHNFSLILSLEYYQCVGLSQGAKRALDI